MKDEGLPFRQWFLRAVVLAAIGFAGWLARDFSAKRDVQEQAVAERRARLVYLRDLLEESAQVFRDQQRRAFALRRDLQQSDERSADDKIGTDRYLALRYDSFNPRQAREHALLRSSTLGSMHRVNQAMLDWLESDSLFKSVDQSSPTRDTLATWLRQLERHLNQWHDKFVLFEADSTRALVWMADEDAEGVGFPSGIERIVEATISDVE